MNPNYGINTLNCIAFRRFRMRKKNGSIMRSSRTHTHILFFRFRLNQRQQRQQHLCKYAVFKWYICNFLIPDWDSIDSEPAFFSLQFCYSCLFCLDVVFCSRSLVPVAPCMDIRIAINMRALQFKCTSPDC